MAREPEAFKKVFTTSAACPSLEELLDEAGRHDTESSRHIGQCPRCAGEFALFGQFLANHGSPGLVPTVRRVDQNVSRAIHKSRPSHSWLSRLLRPVVLAPAMAAMAAALIVVGVGLPQRGAIQGRLLSEGMERAQTVELLAPKGEVPTAPGIFRWTSVPKASSYRVKLMEVDKNVIWETETRITTVGLPAGIQKLALPGKRLIWTVEALNSQGQSVGTGTQDFRRAIVHQGRN
jgi:hypothetical protein